MELQADINLNLSVERDPIDEEAYITQTSSCQLETEECVEDCFRKFTEGLSVGIWEPTLLRRSHINYLNKSLISLPESCKVLDSSRTWLCYWITHSLYLLNAEPSQEKKDEVIDFLSRCQSDRGGFGGGPGQDPHIAPTYAVVLCMATLGTTKAYKMVNRASLSKFLNEMKVGDGSFYMHRGGEIDIRAVYCAIVIAKLMNVFNDTLFEKSAEWIIKCQTYEGGFAGFPGMEAHGGYSFCAIAALHLLNAQHKCNIDALLRWAVNRQMRFEGGFQGRTNKLVDVCYSFWQGSTAVLASVAANFKPGLLESEQPPCLCHSEALQEYILICCQHNEGGFKDKPKTMRDCYHTCYALGGLSLAQHTESNKVVGNPKNLLPPIHPIFNVGMDKIDAILEYFKNAEVPLKK